MSDATLRRQDDQRMNRVEATVDNMREDLSEVREKIFDGFADSIQNTENKVIYLDERNREEHRKIMSKMDKILYLWLSGSITVLAGIVFLIIKGMA